MANTLQNTQRTPTKWGANIPPGVGTDSSRPYPDIANCTYLDCQIRVYSLSNMHIPITKNAFPHYQIRIFVPHFVCIFLYAGAINRPLQLLTVCQLRGEHSARLQRTHREKSTNTYEKPTKHSAKHSTYTYEMGYEHSARRRGRFIVPVS